MKSARAFGLILLLASSHIFAYRLGGARATHTQHAACQATHIEQLQTGLQQISDAAANANTASLKFGELISARQQQDVAATQEIRHALKTTAHLRVDCVFDPGVMHALTAARDRANAAAAGGIEHPVPTTAGPE